MSILVLVSPVFVVPPVLERAWLRALPVARREQLEAAIDPRARRASLLASRLLLEGLRRLGHGDSALASLRCLPGLRPTLDVPLQFSVSHCEDRVVCALAARGPVGVDIERLGRLRAEAFHLYLNAAERAWAGRSARRFYSVWTRKEAVAKAAGTRGMPALHAVDTAADEAMATYAGEDWHTPAIAVGSRHVAHLALRDPLASVTLERVPRHVLERAA